MAERMLAAIAVAALAGCSPQLSPDPRADDVPPLEAIGEPERCINTSRITNTIVRSDSVIDFRMQGGPDYRNTLAGRCLGLGFDRRFQYDTTAGELCAGYTIRVPEPSGGPGRTCALGEFMPVDDIGY